MTYNDLKDVSITAGKIITRFKEIDSVKLDESEVKSIEE